MVWPWTRDAPRIPTDFTMNNNCKIKPLIKTCNEEETDQLSSNPLTHNCFLFNFLKRGRERNTMLLLCPIQDETKFTSLKVSLLQNSHVEGPKRDRALVLKFWVFFRQLLPWGVYLLDKSHSSTTAVHSAGSRKDLELIPIISRLLSGRYFLTLHSVSIDITICSP